MVNCDSLYSPVCLSNLGGSSLLCDLTSLKDLRRLVDLLFYSAVYLLLGQVTTPKLFLTEARDSEFWDIFLINGFVTALHIKIINPFSGYTNIFFLVCHLSWNLIYIAFGGIRILNSYIIKSTKFAFLVSDLWHALKGLFTV